ncbi:DUF7331 family protein [Halegenticoccus tardaugens]|uniref:DUF7331 family protein n=1 Tax=Halegenticoccus tardaugens TaxID=2071624 RepID=UPI00100AA4A7|nr:hypothetical protein [Halegenticoccus tardaugens]
MVNDASDERWDEMDTESASQGEDPDVGTIESYETDSGVVFYDAENPLAWVQAARAIRLKEHA